MQAFFASLSPVQKVFLFCAITGGIVFILRIALMLFGLGDHDFDMDHGDFDHVDFDHGDFDHPDDHLDSDSSFKLFSLQGLTGFFMMFGVVGLGLSRQALIPDIFAVVIGTLAGLFTVWLLGKLMFAMNRLQSDGTVKISNAIGAQGKVYLRIPVEGTGQVQIPIQGRLMMYDAVSTGKEEIKTGDQVVVIDITGGNILVVEKA